MHRLFKGLPATAYLARFHAKKNNTERSGAGWMKGRDAATGSIDTEVATVSDGRAPLAAFQLVPPSTLFPGISTRACHISRRSPPGKTPPSLIG